MEGARRPGPRQRPDPQRRQPRDHLKTFLLARLSLIVEISIAHGNEDNSLRSGSSEAPILPITDINGVVSTSEP